MAVLTNTMMQGTAAATGEDSYQIEKSLRFNPSDNTHLSRVIDGTGNKRTWTFSCWVKLEGFTVYRQLFSSAADANNYFIFEFSSNDQIKIFSRTGGADKLVASTSALYRDPTAWMHVVFSADTTHADQSERAKLWINAERVPLTFSTAPAQDAEFYWLTSGAQHRIGHAALDGAGDFNGYVTDVHFIDGLSLAPAAFGSFDSSGAWNPKNTYNNDGKFALPAPNQGVTWTPSSGGPTNPGQMFNGDLSDYCQLDNSAGTKTITTQEITVNTSLRVRVGSNAGYFYDWTINGVTYRMHTSAGAGWYDIPIPKNTTITSFTAAFGPSSGDYIYAWEVDGVILVDGRTDFATSNHPHDGTVWSDHTTANNGFAGSTPATKGFDGDLSSSAHLQGDHTADSTVTFDVPGDGLPFHTLRIYGGKDAALSDANAFTVNGTDISSQISAGNNWKTITGVSSPLTEVTARAKQSGQVCYWHAIELDGVILRDGFEDHSFHLKFNDTSSDNKWGKDSLNGRIGTVTAGLPIYNTTDDFGEVKGSGNRTDSLSSNLKLAIPGDSVSSTAMDVSSADHDVTVDGVTVSTDESRFYGSSLLFESANTDRLLVEHADFAMGTGDFCVEFWVYNLTNKNYNAWLGTRETANGTEGGFVIASNASGWLYAHSNGAMAGSYTGEHKLPLNTWCHVAYTRASGKHRIFLNGVAAATASTTSRNYTEDELTIGDNGYAQDEPCNGYMQDIRVYKGVAKYTANFTPPNRHDWIPNNFSRADGSRTVAAATKALPIANTTGDQGETKGSGYRTDPHKANLVLAILGDTLTDVSNHADLRNSGSAKGTDANGNCAVSTTTSRFYGSSISFDGTSDYLEVDNSSDYDMDGDFCAEAWLYVNAYTNDYAGIFGFSHDGNGAGWNLLMRSDGTLHMNVDMNYTDVANANVPLKKWTHVALVRNGTSSANCRVYVNGVSGSTTLSENDTTGTPSSTECMLGSYPGYTTTREFNGYMQDIRIYKGVAKYTANFDPDIPLLGAPENIDTYTDSPTNYGSDTGIGGEVRGNYCTWNILDAGDTGFLSNGNLAYINSGSNWRGIRGTIGIPDGKYYWECMQKSVDGCSYGIASGDTNLSDHVGGGSGTQEAYTWGGANYYVNGTGSATSLAAMADGDIIGVAFDRTNGKIHFSRNGQWYGHNGSAFVTVSASDVAAGTNPFSSSISTALTYLPAHSNYGSGNGCHVNFGQRAFEYTAPSGFKCLCTANFENIFSGDNLNNPSKYFDIVTYIGDGATTQNIPTLSFQPELVWQKIRNQAGDHALTDAARGTAAGYLQTEDTNVETGNDNDGVSAFLSNGFTAKGGFNSNTNKWVSFCWDAGTSAATASTEGSVTPSAQWVNNTAGFSITKWTVPSSGTYTVGHGLSAKPDVIICKNTELTSNWDVYHHKIGASYRFKLNTSSAKDSQSGAWNNTEPTNTVFTTTVAWQGAADVMVAYAWTGIPGYSKFGTYKGTSYVYTGFRPNYVLIKSADTAAEWHTHIAGPLDDGNQVQHYIRPDVNNAEGTDGGLDFLSNGFRTRSTGDWITDTTMIYMAFAENPFKVARAR